MPKTVFEPSIKSRPVYGELSRVGGKTHFMIADAVGAEAISKVLSSASPDFLAKTHVMYIPKESGEKYIGDLQSLGVAQLYIGPSYEASVQRLRHVLAEEHMGLQIYLAGTEGLIGQAMREAILAGVPHTSIQIEHRGSIARRMQCIHCKGITEDVTTDPFICSHCGLSLFVRDHYSRRLAAFQAVRIDAEDPGNIPESVERFK